MFRTHAGRTSPRADRDHPWSGRCLLLGLLALVLGAPTLRARDPIGYSELMRRLDEVLRVTSREELVVRIQLTRSGIRRILGKLRAARAGDEGELAALSAELPEWEDRVREIEQVVPKNRYWVVRRLREVIDPRLDDYLEQVRSMRRRARTALALPEVREFSPMGEVVRRGLQEMVRHTSAALRVAARIRGRFLHSRRLDPYGGATFWCPPEPYRARRWEEETRVIHALRLCQKLLDRSRVPALVESLEVLEDAIPGLATHPVERLGGNLTSWSRIRRATTHTRLLDPIWRVERSAERVGTDQERLGRVLEAFRVRLGGGGSGGGRLSTRERRARRELDRVRAGLGVLTTSWDPEALVARVRSLREVLRSAPEPDPFVPLKDNRKLLLSHLDTLRESALLPALEGARSELQEVELELARLWSRLREVRGRLGADREISLRAGSPREADGNGSETRLSVD